ncbi:MAG TPA: alpha/beta hydrolase-fold protein [Lentimicrobium sp.]|nr:alpha/beta hydrolase-fold protein [Lentimicrobium sp.]
MKKNYIIFTLLALFLLSQQTKAQTIQIGEVMSFTSKALNEPRSIAVYKPTGYLFNNEKYPVIYLLDGETHFHHATGIVQFLSAQGLMPEAIVIGIINVDRTRDFSPTSVEGMPNTGGADKFMKYLSEELIPFVDSNFRTQPYRILTGHSFGGEFATYALLNRPDVFNAYISISPYLMYDNNYMIKQAESKIRSKYPKGIKYHMTVGFEPNYLEPLTTFQNIVNAKSPGGLEFTYEVLQKENHGTTPHLSIYKGLEWIYTGWKLPLETLNAGLGAINAHYKKLSKTYGYEINAPELILNQVGYNYLMAGETNKAIEVFRQNTELYPRSANVFDSLGEALEKAGRTGEAIKSFQKAVDVAQKTNNPNLATFELNLKRLQEKTK